jgi:nucleoside-diphosphate-sugar epimerase
MSAQAKRKASNSTAGKIPSTAKTSGKKSKVSAKKSGDLCLVTGACGFSGQQLVRMLVEQGKQVIATDLPGAFEHPKISFISQNVGLDLTHPNITVIPSDLTDPESLKPLFKKPLDYIFHTASLYDYSAPMALLKKVNIDGSLNLFDLACKQKSLKRFVHWSTCGVFGKPYTAREGEKCNLPFAEDACSSPRNTPFEQDQPTGTHLVNDYSITKWKQEQIAWKYYREEGLPLTVIRPAPLYGAGSDYGHGGIVIAINKGWVPAIPTDAKNYITSSVHVNDIDGFAIYIADKDFGLGEDYNIVDDSVISYYEFINYIGLLVGRRIGDIPLANLRRMRPVMIAAAEAWIWLENKFNVPRIRVFEPSSATYMSSSYWISNKKSKDAGYQYDYPDVREGLRDTVDWFRRVGWLDKSYNPKAAWKEYSPD